MMNDTTTLTDYAENDVCQRKSDESPLIRLSMFYFHYSKKQCNLSLNHRFHFTAFLFPFFCSIIHRNRFFLFDKFHISSICFTTITTFHIHSQTEILVLTALHMLVIRYDLDSAQTSSSHFRSSTQRAVPSYTNVV